MRIRIDLAYDGTDFAGWQVQPDSPTVQGLLRDACARILGGPVKVTGASRTDAGVHALAQVASFTTESPIPAENLAKALNDILPPSIRVLEVTEAPPEFHARKSAQAKTYRYRMYRGAICPPFLARYVWHYPFPLYESAMALAAELVVGEQGRVERWELPGSMSFNFMLYNALGGGGTRRSRRRGPGSSRR